MLTDTLLRGLKATGNIQKKSDGGGLYIHVTPTGTKLWRMAYRFDGKQKTLSFGQYPYIGLKTARELRNESRELLARGIDPSKHKKAVKEARITNNANSFEVIALEWISKQENNWTPTYTKRTLTGLKSNIFPILGSTPIKDITSPMLLSALRIIEKRGAIDTAHRVLQTCGCIFRYAIATGRGERDISADLRGALSSAKSRHLSTITEPKAVGQLLRDIDNYHGHAIVKLALQISPYVFVRPTELRMATWNEFNLDNAEWHIPAERMKMRQIHIVPLARQVVELLRDLSEDTDKRRFLFPSLRGDSRSISNATLLRALRCMGYSKDEMTVHGFRSMASTLLNGKGYNRDWIERQLAHCESNSVRASYNHSDYLQDRKRMMQEWADYLDELRGDKND